MADNSTTWTEEASHLYQTLAPIAVPARAEQLASLLTLLPFNRDEPFKAVEIGSGQGILAAALLRGFPKASVIALDGSAAMRAKTGQRLAEFGPRGEVSPFELTVESWHHYVANADCVVSSLCLHHLSAEEKRKLYPILHHRLSDRGVLLIADLVAPQRIEIERLFAATWDRDARAQSLAQTGTTTLFETFQQTQWNTFRYPDPVDQPSPLFDQLGWLKEAGFATVDCFWMQAGHAIYGGYKAGSRQPTTPLSFADALNITQQELLINYQIAC